MPNIPVHHAAQWYVFPPAPPLQGGEVEEVVGHPANQEPAPIEWDNIALAELLGKRASPKRKVEILDYSTLPIGEVYGFHTQQTKTELLKKIKQKYPFEIDIQDNTLVGIEVEVENIEDKPNLPGVWAFKEDGSLRNNGIEYVSHPIEAQYAPSALLYLKESLTVFNQPEYTQRTSIHVHFNVQDMSFKQIQAFTLLYLCFESLFYEYAGKGRKKSIFCVPLSHAGYVGKLKEFFSSREEWTSPYFTNYFKNWHKYTGFNLIPVQELGTIEFRHLSGTDDVVYISKWIALILSLKKAALIYDVETLSKVVADLNTNSEYYIFASNIFKDTLEYLPKEKELQEVMEGDISHIKECFSPNSKIEIVKESFESSYFYKRHKITTIKKKVTKYEDQSLEELEKYLKKLYVDYHNSVSQEEKDIINQQYKYITDAIVIKKNEQGFF